MSIEIQQMTAEEFAAARVALGERVNRFGAVWWLRTKGLFYVPLLPHEACSPADEPPVGLGGFQHVVSNERDANSVLSFLVLDQLQDYSLTRMDQKRRWLIKNALKQFSVKRIVDAAAFKEQGFLAYSSFYHRTGYAYKSERKGSADYARWADAVLRFPKALVLGGYDQAGALRAVSISYWVGPTLTYATFFSDTPALQKGVGEAMFHVLREAVGSTRGIRDVVLRKYQGGNGMDQYYILRGANLVRKPACVRLNPAAKLMLKVLFPNRYAALVGASANGKSSRPQAVEQISSRPSPRSPNAALPQTTSKES